MRSRHLNAGGLVVLMLCGIAMPAAAQAASATDQSVSKSDMPMGIEEVVVTARRRAEDIESVPAAINVISAAALRDRGIHTQEDLQSTVPGLVVRENGYQNNQNFVIRGEALDSYSGSVPGVQPYINDVPLSANNAVSFYDIENVQVLKGPQGTLFGRNSTGGAVLFQTTQPSSQFGGYAQIQYGNLDKLNVQGAVDVPIVADKLLARVAGDHSSGGAYVRNLYDGRTYGDNGDTSVRGTLLARPSTNFTNTLTVEYAKFSGTNAPLFPIYVVPCGGTGPGNTCKWDPSVPIFNEVINSATGTYFPNYPNGYVFPGGLAALPAFLMSKGKYVVDTCCDFTHRGSNFDIQNTTVYDVLPELTIKNIFGYSRTHSGNSYGNSNSPYPILIAGGTAPGGSKLEDLRTRTISDELQLQGKAFGDRLTYIVGVFYVDEKDENNSPLHGIVLFPATNSVYVFNLRYHSFSEDTSYAAFAQATYALTNKLNFTLGGRYTTDRLSIRQAPDSTLQGAALATNESNPSWTASLDYHFTPNLMVYLTTRGSWRVGGYDPFIAPKGNTTTAAAGGSYFLPEKVHDVELGAKFNGHIGDVPFQVNGDLFNQWAENAQKSASGVVAGRITSATVNAPAAEVTGADLDFEVVPADWLHIGGSATAQYARYTQNKANLYGVDVVFGPYADAPRYSGALYANITQPLGDNLGTLTYHVDAYAQSTQYMGNLGKLTPGNRLPAYALVNMRLNWIDPLNCEGVTVSAFVKNLTDKYYYTGGSAAAQATSLEYADMGLPRNYGFVVRYDF